MSSSVERTLEAIQEKLVQAELTGDAGALESILAEDFQGIDPTGSQLDKASVIAGYTEGGFALDTLRVEDVDYQVLENVGIASGRSIMQGRVGGEEFEAEFCYRDIYVRRDGDWKLVASQLTPIRNHQPRDSAWD